MMITDQAPSTKVAMSKLIKNFKLKPNCHCTSKYLNNFIEHNQSINTAKNTLKGIECIYGLYKRIVGFFRFMDFRCSTKLVTCWSVKRTLPC